MRRRMTHAITANVKPRDPDHIASNIEETQPSKNVYLSGFFGESRGLGLAHSGKALARSVERLGCKVVQDLAQAELVLRNVTIGREIDFGRTREKCPEGELVLLYGSEDQRQEVEAVATQHNIRSFKRPIIPSVLRDVLFREKEKIARRRQIRDGQDPSSPGVREPKRPPSMSKEKRPTLKHRASPPVQMGPTAPILVVEDNPIVSPPKLRAGRNETLMRRDAPTTEPKNPGAVPQEECELRPVIARTISMLNECRSGFSVASTSGRRRRASPRRVQAGDGTVCR
jgi:hypothetical protein